MGDILSTVSPKQKKYRPKQLKRLGKIRHWIAQDTFPGLGPKVESGSYADSDQEILHQISCVLVTGPIFVKTLIRK